MTKLSVVPFAVAVAAAVLLTSCGDDTASPTTAPSPLPEVLSFRDPVPAGEELIYRVRVESGGVLRVRASWTEPDASLRLLIQDASPPFETVANSGASSGLTAETQASVLPREYLVLAGNFSDVDIAQAAVDVTVP